MVMKIKLLLIAGLFGVSCADADKGGTQIIELYSGGTIINVWEAKNIYRSGGNVYFTDIYCDYQVKIYGTYIITPTDDYENFGKTH